MDLNLGSHLRNLYSERHLHQLPEKEALLPAWSPPCSLTSLLTSESRYPGTSKAPLSHRSKNTPLPQHPFFDPPLL